MLLAEAPDAVLDALIEFFAKDAAAPDPEDPPMNLTEYANYDALGPGRAGGQEAGVARRSWRRRRAKAIEVANPTINAVVETYPDRIDGLDEKTLGNGPFRGVPFLIKDVFGHEKGRKIEFGAACAAA